MNDPKSSESYRSEGRDSLGRFGPGNAGKPYGAKAKNKLSRSTLAAVQDLASLAVFKLRERIEAGDMVAIRLCLEATLPRGGRTIEMETASPTSWADALAEGEITPVEAATAAQALVRLNEAGELVDLTKRIEELENALAERQR